MIIASQELELFDRNPEWRLVLAAYAELHAQSTAEWLPRLPCVDGVPFEQLSMVHGRLMALGFLAFEVGSRTDGLQYQLTATGKHALLPPESRRPTDALAAANGSAESELSTGLDDASSDVSAAEPASAASRDQQPDDPDAAGTSADPPAVDDEFAADSRPIAA